MTSPPGGESVILPHRASNGPASRMDARMRTHSAGSSASPRTSLAWIRKVFGAVHSTSAPTVRMSSTNVSMSRICGTLVSVTG